MGFEADGKAATRNSKVGSTPTGSTNSGLIHGFTLSTTTHSNTQHPVCGQVVDMRYVASGERPLKNK